MTPLHAGSAGGLDHHCDIRCDSIRGGSSRRRRRSQSAAAASLGGREFPVLCEACLHHPHLLPAPPSELTRPVLLPSFEVHGGNPFRLAAAIRVGKHDARGAAAALLTLRRRRVRNDDILAGDGLAAGLASMFRLRNGLRGSQSRMA